MNRALVLPAALAGLALAAGVAAVAQGRLARLNLEETELTAQQAENLSELSRLLSVVERLRRDPPPALLVSPDDAKQAVRAAILVKAMTPELQARARTYAAAAGEMARQRRLAAIQNAALFARESQSADRAQDALGPELDLRGPAPPPPDEAIIPPRTLVMPISGPVVRRFGDTLAGGGRANGITLAASGGVQVESPGAGLVQYVGPVKGWGEILILRLAGGYHLVLAGLERTSVHVGQSVAPGQPVGWMPDGRQSTSELYLEVREQGSPVNPARWLNKNAG